MTELATTLENLRRPRLLIRAARFGLTDYNRDRHLKRLIKADRTPSPERALEGLLEEEARLNSSRTDDTGDYDLSRHIDMLIAIMAEARLFLRPENPS